MTTIVQRVTLSAILVILERVEQLCGKDDANALRAYILALHAAVDDDEAVEDG